MSIRSRLALVLMFGALLIAPRTVTATLVVELGVPELARLSDMVVRATVLSVTTQPSEDAEDLRPITEVALEIEETLKGERDQGPLLLRFVGGRHGEFTTRIAGMPAFQPGEETVLFLEETARGLTPTGLKQGKFTVVRREPGFGPVVTRDLSGLRLVAPDAELEEVECAGHGIERLPLATLTEEIRITVERHGHRPEPLRVVLPMLR